MSVVLFDLDDTLTDRRVTLEHYVEKLLEAFAAQLGAADMTRVLEAIAEVDERGYAPREQVFAHLLKTLPWRRPPLLENLADHWRHHYPRSVVAREGALETLTTLLDRQHTLGLVTNGPVALQQTKIDKLGIEPLFKTVVISEQVGAHKPDPRVFHRALDQLACTAGETWFVGDHPRNDIIGAAGVGIRPIWLAGIHPWPDDIDRPGDCIERIDQVPGVVDAQG